MPKRSTSGGKYAYRIVMQSEETRSRILVVDDDRLLCNFLQKFLSGEGYGVTCANEGREMRRALADQPFDLVILDLTFSSGDDGITLARGLRAQYDFPVIVLSGKSTTIDKVVCLELGADDYITKPFEPRELLARVRSVLRRAVRRIEPAASGEVEIAPVCFAGWRLDPTCYQLKSPEGEAVRLTSQEFQVLTALVQRRGRILSREQILEIVANRNWTPYDRSIDVLIGKIRRKLNDSAREMQFIKTIRGIGYMFAPPEGH